MEPTELDRPRWTHLALTVADADQSARWYEEFTPLVRINELVDDTGTSIWLSNPGQYLDPMVLVLVTFTAERGTGRAHLAPFAHLGIEVPTRADVDDVARRARAGGVLVVEPTFVSDAVGYVCMVSDPDGNRVEFSHRQQVFARTREVFGGDGPGDDPSQDAGSTNSVIE